MKAIYIGDEFFHASSKMMSSVYSEHGDRLDWGMIRMALRGGEHVEIRQATEREKEQYRGLLERLQQAAQVQK